MEFSVQNLIDCPPAKQYISYGCNLGLMTENFKYVKDNPGIDFEHVYQFENRNEACRFREDGVGTLLTGKYCTQKISFSDIKNSY